MNIRGFKFSIFCIAAAAGFFALDAGADTLHQNVTFNVNTNFDRFSRQTLRATLRHISERAYFYVDDGFWNRLTGLEQTNFFNNIKELAVDFDSKIYPLETEFFGSIPLPGIDNDDRVTILIEEVISGNGGYFDSSNIYRKSQISDSNEREMISLSGEAVQLNLNLAKIFLAHEFQHLISVNQKELIRNLTEEMWLNEVRSEYGITVSGYNELGKDSSLVRRKANFLQFPSDSLVEWPNKTADYAIAALFAEYLGEQYGKSMFADTLKDDSIGINSINKYLARTGKAERFSDIFLNWMTAVIINNTGFDSRYGYKRDVLKDVRVTPERSLYLTRGLAENSRTILIKTWQPVWQDVDVSALDGDPTQSFKIEISGQADQGLIGNHIVTYKNGSKEVFRVPFGGSKSDFTVINSEKGIMNITLLMTSAGKVSDFGINEPETTFTVKVSTVETEKAKASVLQDGALIRKGSQAELYVIDRGYRRYLSPEVIKLYGHLNPANAISVSPEVFDSYKPTNYVRYVNDEKVYAVWPDNTKHWLNITAQQWDGSGRDWNAIFIVNDLEVNSYKLGAPITR